MNEADPLPAHFARLVYRPRPETGEGQFERVRIHNSTEHQRQRRAKQKNLAPSLTDIWWYLEGPMQRGLDQTYDLDAIMAALAHIERDLIKTYYYSPHFEMPMDTAAARDDQRSALIDILFASPNLPWQSASTQAWRRDLLQNRDNWENIGHQQLAFDQFQPNNYNRMVDCALGLAVWEQAKNCNLDDAKALIDLLQERHRLGLPPLTRQNSILQRDNNYYGFHSPRRYFPSQGIGLNAALNQSCWPFDWVNTADFPALFAHMVDQKSYILAETVDAIPAFVGGFLMHGDWDKLWGIDDTISTAWLRAWSPSQNMPGQLRRHMRRLNQQRTWPEHMRVHTHQALQEIDRMIPFIAFNITDPETWNHRFRWAQQDPIAWTRAWAVSPAPSL